MSDPAIVPGRGCNGCTMCCKLLKIAVLNKPPLVWCEHCDVGVGCKIYEARPQVCREFICEYLRNPNLGEEWRPDQCKMVVLNDSRNKAVVVQVDSSRPNAWRMAPFYEHIKKVAERALANNWYLVVWEGAEAVVVLPDRDVRLGKVEGGSIVVSTLEAEDGSVRYEAKFVPA